MSRVPEGGAGSEADRKRWLAAVAALGTLLLGLSWAMTNPPGAAPDEGSNYVRAIASAFGNNTGRRYIAVPPDPTPRAILDSEVHRQFDLPADFAPVESWGCHRFTRASAACTGSAPSSASGRAVVVTGVGPYPPLFYALMGLPARAMGSATAALYAARVAALTITWLLLVLAWWAARDAWTRVGIVLATTPMVVFLGSSVSVSGIEVAAAIAFASVLTSMVDRGAAHRWMPAAFAVTGVALASARIFGPIWVIFAVGFVVVAFGSPVPARRHGPERRRFLGAIVPVVMATLVTVIWVVVAAPHTPSSIRDAIRSAPQTLALVPSLLDQTVGVFGWLDTPLPPWTTWLIVGLQCTLVTVALALGSWRQRGALLLALVGLPLVVVAVDGLTQIPTGFRVQARYVMPMSAMVLVFAGAVAGRGRLGSARIRRAALALAMGAVTAVVVLHPLAWYVNSHRSAVGTDGSWSFVLRSEWAPFGGWWPWMGLTALAGVASLIGLLGGVARAPRFRAPAVAAAGRTERRPGSTAAGRLDP